MMLLTGCFETVPSDEFITLFDSTIWQHYLMTHFYA